MKESHTNQQSYGQSKAIGHVLGEEKEEQQIEKKAITLTPPPLEFPSSFPGNASTNQSAVIQKRNQEEFLKKPIQRYTKTGQGQITQSAIKSRNSKSRKKRRRSHPPH